MSEPTTDRAEIAAELEDAAMPSWAC